MRNKGFTLVELLTGFVLSFVVMGALIATYNVVNKGVKNTTRSNDMTQTTRTIFQIMGSDIAQAGRGVSDLGGLQVHFAHDSQAAIEGFFYPVVLLPGSNNRPELVLQWFEYDLLNSPTYAVADPTPVLPSTPGEFVLATYDAGDPQLNELGAEDIFLLYDPRIIYEEERHRRLRNEFDGNYVWNETDLNNGAMIVQASAVAVGTYGAEVTVGNGPTFRTTFDPVGGDHDGETIDIEDEAEVTDTLPGTALSAVGLSDGVVNLKSGTWLARRLGDANSFRRVRYYVNDQNALIRREEGVGEAIEIVIATNVVNFDLLVGVDIADPAVEQETTDWDNAVSVQDGVGYWQGVSGSLQEVVLAGRHGLALRVSITIESEIGDIFDDNASGDGSDIRQRTFERLFKIRNNRTPLLSY